jgi:hypothetical protein
MLPKLNTHPCKLNSTFVSTYIAKTFIAKNLMSLQLNI